MNRLINQIPRFAGWRRFASLPPAGASRVSTFQTTVWDTFTPLANLHKAVNLGQGFPDFKPPEFVLEAGQRAILPDNMNQYSPARGHPRLIAALSDQFSGPQRRLLKPENICVSAGATQGIFAAMQALVEPGDEVILIEPFYDSYTGSVICAGGTPKFVPLRSPSGCSSASEWFLDIDEVKKQITPRTRMIVINTPLNPVGKIFSRTELQQIADLVLQHPRMIVLSDEVYQHITYGTQHESIATLDGMFDRTITLGSAGKSFSVTGWKVGWALGPEPLITSLVRILQYITFCVATPLQIGIASAFEQTKSNGYFQSLPGFFDKKREAAARAIRGANLTPMIPDGSYFMLADTRPLQKYVKEVPGENYDYTMCKWLTSHVGVTAIPPSAFYSSEHAYLARDLARFCFCKEDSVLAEATRRLAKIHELA